MRKILKRSMAWLLIVAMFVGLIPYAAFANDGDKDVSKQFKITEFSVKPITIAPLRMNWAKVSQRSMKKPTTFRQI